MHFFKNIFITLLLICLVQQTFGNDDNKPKKNKKAYKINIPKLLNSKDFLDFLMKEDTSQSIYKVLYNPRKYRLQIIYTQINRDKQNKPKLKTFTYRANNQEYFYPASLVKLPIIALALEKLHRLNIKGLGKNSSLFCQRSSGAGIYQTTVAESIKKMLIASDNFSYTILYEFVGQRYLHQRLREMGFPETSITQNFSYSGKPFNSFQFLNSDGTILYDEKPEGRIPQAEINVKKTVVAGMNFKYANHFPLEDAHKILTTLLFHESFPPSQQFHLTYDDYEFLHRYMSIFPRECKDPAYDENNFFDSSYKYFLNAKNRSRRNSTIRCFNKVGIAIGFISDCSYFVDYENKTEFFLSAVIYVNENEKNAGYEYYSVGFPFFTNLSRVINEYEKTRKRKYTPVLEQIDYY